LSHPTGIGGDENEQAVFDLGEVQRFVGAFYRAMDAVDLNVAKADPALAIYTSRPCNSAAAAWQTGFTHNRDDKS
jgi:hypothetical protein